MDTTAKLNQALFEGESETIEFKVQGDDKSLPREICAFANNKGGTIFVGVAEAKDKLPETGGADHSVIGVDPDSVFRVTKYENLQRYFGEPCPGVQTEPLDMKGPRGPVVAVHVSPHSGSELIALSDGSVWMRDGTHTVALPHSPTAKQAMAESTVEFSQSAEPSVTKAASTSEESDVNSVVPLSEIRKFNLTSTVLGAIEHAQQIIRENGHEEPINSSHIVFGLIRFGRARGDSPHFAKFLADQVFPKYERKYDTTLSSYTRRASARLKRYSNTQLRSTLVQSMQLGTCCYCLRTQTPYDSELRHRAKSIGCRGVTCWGSYCGILRKIHRPARSVG